MGQFTTDEAQAKLADAMDPNNDYSYDDFMYDFGSIPLITESHKMDISFVNESTNQDPDWETTGSAGFDLRASVNANIHPNEYRIISTGLYFDLPENFEIQIRPRSGLAAKFGITVLNAPGTIDSDYTGEIKVILINHGKEIFNITNGDRIAQAVLSTVTAKNIINLKKVKSIDKETDRGSGGFGSTGLK